MALIDCRECLKQISDQAATCPHCGAPLNTPTASVAPYAMTCPHCSIALIPITRPVSVSLAGFFGIVFVLIGIVVLLFNIIAGVLTIIIGVAISNFFRAKETVMTCPKCHYRGAAL